MIDVSKIKLTSQGVAYDKMQHTATLKLHGVMFSTPDARCQADAQLVAKMRLWDGVYGELHGRVLRVRKAFFRAAQILPRDYFDLIDELQNSTEDLAKAIQYPDENPTTNPTQPSERI